MFSFIPGNWRVTPYVSHQAIVQLIAATHHNDQPRSALRARFDLTLLASRFPTTKSQPSTSSDRLQRRAELCAQRRGRAFAAIVRRRCLTRYPGMRSFDDLNACLGYEFELVFAVFSLPTLRQPRCRWTLADLDGHAPSAPPICRLCFWRAHAFSRLEAQRIHFGCRCLGL